MSKAEQIRKLLAAGKLSRREIAERVGCLREYVCAVADRHACGGERPADKAWKKTPAYRSYHAGYNRTRAAKKSGATA